MKTLNTILMTLVALAGTTAMKAQTKAGAHIPFDFTVATKSMPAGDYTLKCSTESCNVLQIVNSETRKAVVVMVRDDSASTKHPDKGAVMFHRYEDTYYFSGVRTPGGWQVRTAPSAHERELSAANSNSMLAEISIPLAALR